MSRGEIVTLLVALMTIGIGTVGALIRTIFVGIRSRIDKLEGKVDRCMEQMIRLAKGGGDG